MSMMMKSLILLTVLNALSFAAYTTSTTKATISTTSKTISTKASTSTIKATTVTTSTSRATKASTSTTKTTIVTTSTRKATTATTSALTTLPSSSKLTSTGSVSISGISTAHNGSILATSTSSIIVPSPSGTPIVPHEHRLVIQQTSNAPYRFQGLYLAGWNLIANSTADAVFTANCTQAAKFYLNSTILQADFGSGLEWAVSVSNDYVLGRWFMVKIRRPIHDYFGSFYFNRTGIQWTPNETPPPHNGSAASLDNYFGGWMVCDWWHGVPQLFYKVGTYNDTVAPAGCADIQLVAEFFI